MRFIYILCVSVAFATAACDYTAEFPEQAENQPVTVHAMGDWPEYNLMLIQSAFDDWNNGIQARCQDSKQRFIYGGQLLDAPLYDENSAGDGIHGIYRLEPDELTEFGQEVWNEQHVQNKAGATFMDEDDILVYWTLDDSYLTSWVGLQSTIAHELGHGGGLGHVDEEADVESVMKPQGHSPRVQPVDIDDYVGRHGC